MTKTFYFNVKMNCGGCSGAVERALKRKEEDFVSYNVSLEDQIVEVTVDNEDHDAIFDIIKKTGKATRDATEEEIEQYVKKQEELKKKQAEEEEEEEQQQQQ
ncbi:Cytosolic copper metallochaperone [Coemansia sp. RSA 1813]|nr:Cytosolic copper metallochaperone [Coemansia sp. RSA 1646]KAJ1772743.1 Cytosolic copper metallochaperone [Coemansia sp. RSA 1843]KAJ2090695.1 Cytosolic copper metallochaperone [Coemansia sp. RSA 986]KAJ2216100.1 Cytosolic copper metallochaperone [Coemansia sp. RSA 487]KAJ2570087.1 Cytosolic copper metallochaperone [Coemansia sp. RSA 1813]